MASLTASNAELITLENGVRVLLEPMPHVQSAAIGFWVDTGSVVEDEKTNGMCHFIEHMLFKGTARRSALDIARSLEVSGGSLNAFTDKEHTCFHARVLASEVPLALDVLADMLLNSVMDPAEIRREQAVVIEEIKMYEDTPDDLVHDLLAQAMWPEHALRRPITGTRKSVRGLSRKAINEFMASHYTPERLVVSIVGSFERDAVLASLSKLLGEPRERGVRPVSVPAATAGHEVLKYRDIEQVHLCVGVPAVAIGDDRRYTLAVLNCILGGGMSSRLFQEVREKRGLVYSIGSYEALFRDGGMFAVFAGMSPKHLPTVLALIWEELGKAAGGGIDEAELSRAKQTLVGSLALSMEVPRHRMSRLAQNELYFGRFIPTAEVEAAIEAVTLADLSNLAKGLFVPDRSATTVVGPLRKLPA